MILQKKNEYALETHRFNNKNTKNNIKSKNYLKRRTLREFEKLYIDWLVYCYEAKWTMQWAEENIRKDICRLNSKLVSTTNTQIEFS